MEIYFRSQFDSRNYAFRMAFEIQEIFGFFDGVVSCLNVAVHFRRPLPDANQPSENYPVILGLQGKLYRMNQPQDHGATLLPMTDSPISLIKLENPYSSYLSFAVPRGYLQRLEEHRAAQHTQDMQLQVQLWGIVAITKPHPNDQNLSSYFQVPSGDVIRFEKVSTDTSDPAIRIERSAWLDRILPGLGYRHSVLIELPLMRTPPIPETYQKAADALDMARRAFEQEDYRGAAKHARDVLEFFAKSSQGGQITTFCNESLEPFIGGTKSKAIDRSLNAVRDIVNASSHLDPKNPFVLDRATAAYVIETLALNLRYISAVHQ